MEIERRDRLQERRCEREREREVKGWALQELSNERGGGDKGAERQRRRLKPLSIDIDPKSTDLRSISILSWQSADLYGGVAPLRIDMDPKLANLGSMSILRWYT